MTKTEAIQILERRRTYSNYGARLNEAIDMAIESLSAEPKWIPVSEMLPYEHICDDGYVEPSEKVLVCTDAGTILTSRFWGNRQSKEEEPDTYADWVDIDWWHNVIAWMSLPEPYRGGDEE